MNRDIYQLKVSLIDFKPQIWRRLLVSANTKLSNFHKILQTAMGWTNSHLHQFIKDRSFYTVKMEADMFWDDLDNVDYKNMKIADLLNVALFNCTAKDWREVNPQAFYYIFPKGLNWYSAKAF